MATSARDLLALVRDHVDDLARPSTDEADSAITAVGCLGRRLGEMYSAEADLRVGRDAPSDEMRGLIDACHAADREWTQRSGRLPDLVGAACDLIGRHDRARTRAERWAVAVQLNETVRHCVEFAMRPDAYARLSTLHRIHGASIAVSREAAPRPPVCRADGVLDLLVPAGMEAAVEHGVSILDGVARLDQAVRTETRHRAPSVAAALSMAAASEELARHCAGQVPNGGPCSASRAAPASWSVVTAALIRFQDGSLRAGTSPSRIVESAALMQRAVSAASAREREPGSAAQLAAAATYLPRFATYLDMAAGRWHREQRVFAMARDLVRRDELIEAILSRRAVPIGDVDAATMMGTVRMAGRLSSALAAELHGWTDYPSRPDVPSDRRLTGSPVGRVLDEDVRLVSRIAARTIDAGEGNSVAI